VIVAAFVHADPKQWAFFCLAHLLLVIIHEAGHVLAAVAVRLRVFTVEISGVGGLCRIERPRCLQHSIFIYTAGLLAQVLAFLITLAYIGVFGSPGSAFGAATVFTFTVVNVVIFVINLIPQRSSRSGLATDGFVLWRLFLHVFRGHPHPHPPLIAASSEESPIFPQETSLLQRPGFHPPGFVHGIEILNDKTTPMEFVVTTLMNHLGLTRGQALVKMLDIHNTGGALIALQSAKEAQGIAAAVCAEARASGHSFVCRYACATLPTRIGF
jgi:ATP-dependent Clp protease adapter protein ClpS